MALKSAGVETIGFAGTVPSPWPAAITQSALLAALYIGYGSGSHGTYTISGNGSLVSFGGRSDWQ